MHKVIQSHFVILESRSDNMTGFIMQVQQPFFIGKAICFKSEDEYLTNLANSNKWQVTIPGYRILIRFEGSLNEERRLSISDSIAEKHGQIENLLQNMAQYFLREKIGFHSGHYKKYLIKSNMLEVQNRF